MILRSVKLKQGIILLNEPLISGSRWVSALHKSEEYSRAFTHRIEERGQTKRNCLGYNTSLRLRSYEYRLRNNYSTEIPKSIILFLRELIQYTTILGVQIGSAFAEVVRNTFPIPLLLFVTTKPTSYITNLWNEITLQQ